MSQKYIIFFLILAAAPASAANLSFTFGLFEFDATDYYFPNFYDETGFRGEIDYTPNWGAGGRHNFRLQCYGYPMDDNVFEPILEYGFRWPGPFRFGGWRLELVPTAGLGVAKAQYPAPYYPTVEHQYLPWLRGGGDVALSHKLVGPISASAHYRGRVLYYLGSSYAAFANDASGTPLQYLHVPYGEVTIRINESWALLGRGGVEYDGYYEDIFLRGDLRPFGEAGFNYTF